MTDYALVTPHLRWDQESDIPKLQQLWKVYDANDRHLRDEWRYVPDAPREDNDIAQAALDKVAAAIEQREELKELIENEERPAFEKAFRKIMGFAQDYKLTRYGDNGKYANEFYEKCWQVHLARALDEDEVASFQ